MAMKTQIKISIFSIVILYLLSISSLSAQTSAKEFLDIGIKYLEKEQYDKALTNFENAYILQSNDANILAFRGQAKHHLNRFQDAIADYNKALEIQPNYAEVFHLRGLAKLELKDVTGACEDWDKANKLGYSDVIDLIIEYCMPKKTE